MNFSILINREKKGSIVPTRGLRQGDPLSSYLFLLVIEGLSSLLQDANDKGAISGIITSPSSPRISHLLFADNSLIFCKADELNCLNIKRMLMLYEEASSESINFNKSAMIFSPSINTDRGNYLSNLLGIKMKESLDSYLGLPASFSRSKSKDFQYIVDKVWKVV